MLMDLETESLMIMLEDILVMRPTHAKYHLQEWAMVEP